MTTKISDESISTKASAVSASSSNHDDDDHRQHPDAVSSTTTDTKSASAAAAGVNRKTIIDETLLPPDEAEKILARRAYNRDCATRARKRSKQMVAQLEKQVKELQEDKEALRRSLVNMEKQMVELESQNKALKLKQMLASNRVGGGTMADSLAIGTGLPTSSMLQLSQQQQQLRLLRQQAAVGVGGGVASGVDLAQLSRYMNGQNGYF
jgi:hypothetical protein